MNRHLHSPTKLTEFARDFEEEPETLFSKFVNKLTNVYSTSYNTINELPISSNSGVPNSHSHGSLNAQQNIEPVSHASSSSSLNSSKQPTLTQNHENSSSSTNDDTSESLEKSDELSIEIAEGRSMVNVLKRISNIVASRNNNLRNYKDTDLQRFWMPDSKAKECYECAQKFSTFRRKHHCRLCGQIFCSKCCNQVVPGKIIMCSGELKVCTYCSKIVLSYLKSSDITLDLKSDLQALQENLSSKLSLNEDSNPILNDTMSVNRKISVGYQEERLVSSQATNLSNADRRNILQQSNSLKNLHEEMVDILPYQNCGLDLIDYLISKHKSSNRIQAIAILNAMLEAGFLIPLVPDSDQEEFDENLHYKLVRKSDILISNQNFQLDFNTDTNFLPLNRTSKDETSPAMEDSYPPKSMDGSLSFQSATDMELQSSVRSTSSTANQFLKCYCEHEDLLVSQLLRNQNLDQSWGKVLIPLCARMANQFRPELFANELMDVRSFVNFKKVPGGRRVESTIVGGVVFSKNVAHKDMATRVERPKILLLECAIVYERIESRFVSLETLLLQEKDYLANVTARILSLKPNVVLVHKNVTGIAQDLLRSKGITLVLDVKMSVLERLARCLQCDIVTTIKSNIGKPKLGMCDLFYIKRYDDQNGSSKTLMFFEMLSNLRATCCVLRGASNSELTRVKKVATSLVFARFNWRLEMSYLLDEFARPPSPKPAIFDSKEHSPSEEETESKQDDLELVEIIQAETPKIFDKNENKTKSDNNYSKKLLERKSDDKIVTIEDVSDFSDPLRAPESSQPKSDIESSVEFAVQTPYDNRFRSALSSTVLSVSPFMNFPLPFLETEQGRKCPLRSHFPIELYFSKQWSERTETQRNNAPELLEQFIKKVVNPNKPYHPFVTHKMTAPVDSREIQTLLAEFRAFGGCLEKTNQMIRAQNREEQIQIPQKITEDVVYLDALDLENHQRLPVLFYSYYYNPKGASSFCAQPTLLDMKFYGQHDIMLGQFLEKYCFQKSYICEPCNLPIMDHVRRYVHSLGCVQVTLIEDTNKNINKNDTDQIFLASWCAICNEMTPNVPISDNTYCLSFAKFLELRFHGHVYKKRIVDFGANGAEVGTNTTECSRKEEKCKHSLHRDHIQYFSKNGIVVKFMYSPITIYEIGVPSLVLNLKKPKPFDSAQVLEDIKHFAIKGYEIYSKIYDRIAEMATDDESPILNSLKSVLNRDQFIFRQHVEIVQTLLTEKSVQSYDISDAMLMSKRALAESIELWGPRLHEAATQTKTLQKQDSFPPVDSGTICTEDLKPDLDSPVTASKQLDFSIENGKTSTTIEQESISQSQISPQPKQKESASKPVQENISDKISIRQLLSQLLPSTGPVNSLPSPFSSHEHHTLPLGAFPILVNDQDFSSIIAYSLVSNEYKRHLENVNSSSGYVSDTSSSPNVKRKSQEGSFDNDDKDKESTKNEDDKKSKSSSHIDLSFQDSTTQFTCKIYFAKEFDNLRYNAIKPPKLEKSIYKELELSKQLEERKLSQKNSSSPDAELIRKASNTSLPNTKPSESRSDVPQSQSEIDEVRISLARSLCKSVPWEARGGKSGSKFSKTSDDRFILKEGKNDVTIFEHFAPNYFEYVNKCLQNNQPTLLAKIVGVFLVRIKKKDFVQEKFLLVMENLFYDNEVEDKYDLKGSERNRFFDPTNQNGEIVLLDENLMQMIFSKPLYILPHSKQILREAIKRDSSFLERNDVMDYSLLVGLNKENVLIVGIIDYIRTFTFNKRLESLLKQSGLLGGQGKLPTVIPPQRYKQRFSEAMERYFYSVPDRWEGLSKM